MANGQPLKKDHIKQHIVPQCYLKRFTLDGTCLLVYNKKAQKIYKTVTNKICFIDNFYSIDDQYIPIEAQDEINRLSIEVDFFANHVEKDFSTFLDIIENIIREFRNIEGLDLSWKLPFPDEYVENLAYYTLVQRLRTPDARNNVNHVIESIRNQFKGFVETKHLNLTGQAKLQYDEIFKDRGEVIDHFETLFSSNLEKQVEELSHNIWTIAINFNRSFITSDNPVIVDNSLYSDGENLNLNKEGTYVVYPLCEHAAVIMMERTKYHEDSDLDRKVIFCKDDFVRITNICEYINAKKLVITSSKENLDFIENFHKKYGKDLSLKDISILMENSYEQ